MSAASAIASVWPYAAAGARRADAHVEALRAYQLEAFGEPFQRLGVTCSAEGHATGGGADDGGVVAMDDECNGRTASAARALLKEFEATRARWVRVGLMRPLRMVRSARAHAWRQ